MDDDASRALAALGDLDEGGGFVDAFQWGVWERSDDELVLLGWIADDSAPEGVSYAYAGFDREGDHWQPSGWGGCRWGVGHGPHGPANLDYGPADWVPDPDDPPTPDSTTLHLLATERSCASGRIPEDRDVQAIVEESADAVTIVIMVEAVAGGATCPSNPSFPMVVDLAEPLGGRVVLDASLIPPVARSAHQDGFCSAESMAVPGDQEGLPPAVVQTRRVLVEVAAGCDFPGLVQLIGELPHQGAVDEFWWMGTVNTAALREVDQHQDALAMLVRMLDVPYAVRHTDRNGVDTELYVWPPLFWSDDPLAEPDDVIAAAAIANGITVDELTETVEAFGGYALFRVGIWEDGTWAFALSGD